MELVTSLKNRQISSQFKLKFDAKKRNRYYEISVSMVLNPFQNGKL